MRFILGVVIGVLLVGAIFYLYMRSGFAPVATSDSPMPMEKFFAETALHAKLKKDVPKNSPLLPDDATLFAGAKVYTQDCAMCHGLPSQQTPAIARGMFPAPPQLMKPGGMMTHDPPGENFWKVKNGIRLSGMPGFHFSLSDEQLWQVSLLIAKADKLPTSAQQVLAQAAAVNP